MLANTMFVPARKIITEITNAFPARVTTSTDHDYLSGEIIRIQVPLSHGMRQINQQYAPITVINNVSFYIAIDARSYEPFVIPMDQQQFAQTTAIGEINELLDGALHNSLNPQDNI